MASQIQNSTSGTSASRLHTTKTRTDHLRKPKRKRGDDDEGKRPEPCRKLNSDQAPRRLACPFYLHNPLEWHTCLRNYTLSRIVDVRLHLLRVHLLAPQCPVCGEEFNVGETSEDQLRAHMQLQACRPATNPLPPRHGITPDQIEACRRVATRRTERRQLLTDPTAAKWYDIWDIIFPRTARPASPYIEEHPDVQRIIDLNNSILGTDRWRDLYTPTSGNSSFPLQDLSRHTLAAMMDGLLEVYREMYQGNIDHVASQIEEAPAASDEGWSALPFPNRGSISAEPTTPAVDEPSIENSEDCRLEPN